MPGSREFSLCAHWLSWVCSRSGVSLRKILYSKWFLVTILEAALPGPEAGAWSRLIWLEE